MNAPLNLSALIIFEAAPTICTVSPAVTEAICSAKCR